MLSIDRLTEMCNEDGYTIACCFPDGTIYECDKLSRMFHKWIPFHLVNWGDAKGYCVLADRWGNGYMYNWDGHNRKLFRYVRKTNEFTLCVLRG